MPMELSFVFHSIRRSPPRASERERSGSSRNERALVESFADDYRYYRYYYSTRTPVETTDNARINAAQAGFLLRTIVA